VDRVGELVALDDGDHRVRRFHGEAVLARAPLVEELLRRELPDDALRAV
jgi:hypothetical protein